jgi:hypothetical protein|nr:MAG TPA: hypothetical protein [Herelleviridae sp.]
MWIKYKDLRINLDNIIEYFKLNNRVYFKFLETNDNINIDFKNSEEVDIFIEYLDNIIKVKEIKI